jgi:hypothetical protein
MRAISWDGVFAQVRTRTVRRLPSCFEAKPDAPFVRGDNLEARRLAHNRQIGLETAGGERVNTGLRVLFIDQPRKK